VVEASRYANFLCVPRVQSGANDMGETMPDNSRLYIPALGGVYQSLSSYAELLLRGGLGVILIIHALQKFLSWFGGSGMGVLIGLLQKFGYPMPTELGYFLAILELSCGFLLLIGFLVRPAALLFAIFMLFGMHYTAKTGAHPFVWFKGGSELSIVFFLMAAYLTIRGAGPISFDRRIGREF
jgi:putative oxidoreductase